jgi:hypothetical protein
MAVVKIDSCNGWRKHSNRPRGGQEDRLSFARSATPAKIQQLISCSARKSLKYDQPIKKGLAISGSNTSIKLQCMTHPSAAPDRDQVFKRLRPTRRCEPLIHLENPFGLAPLELNNCLPIVKIFIHQKNRLIASKLLGRRAKLLGQVVEGLTRNVKQASCV